MSAIVDIKGCADHIESLQGSDGSINWIAAGIWDAWNHGESAMGLAIAGRRSAAIRALDHLIDRQEDDGSWIGDLGASVPLDADNRHLVPGNPETAKDTNFTGYAAVTILRSLTALDALDQLPRYWPMLNAALDFVLKHQSAHGDVVWKSPDAGESLEDLDSLRAGNASLYKSLECMILVARRLGHDETVWADARRRIGATLRENDARFDRTGIDRRRYAMDWYYPVLTGVLPVETGRARLYARWNEFVQPGLGCRCVADEPWVTAAETAELVMACLSVGKTRQARALLQGLHVLAADNNGYWMGWQFDENVIWPRERPSWTAGALIMAADALDRTSAGSELLITNQIPELTASTAGKVKADDEALPASPHV
ncbi:MAG: hypothetical protein P8P99_14955 [Maricaulis sp.]|jgi:hypothetical protein|nr:hypothetical protein [Maricaulis sp.]